MTIISIIVNNKEVSGISHPPPLFIFSNLAVAVWKVLPLSVKIIVTNFLQEF